MQTDKDTPRYASLPRPSVFQCMRPRPLMRQDHEWYSRPSMAKFPLDQNSRNAEGRR
jgi:hypothetical protein